jgi:hypothetical protein
MLLVGPRNLLCFHARGHEQIPRGVYPEQKQIPLRRLTDRNDDGEGLGMTMARGSE